MFVCKYASSDLMDLTTEVYVEENFSPIYWMVPQMVNALPPLSRRRDKPKSAKRRCPRIDHCLNIMMNL